MAEAHPVYNTLQLLIMGQTVSAHDDHKAIWFG